MSSVLSSRVSEGTTYGSDGETDPAILRGSDDESDDSGEVSPLLDPPAGEDGEDGEDGPSQSGEGEEGGAPGEGGDSQDTSCGVMYCLRKVASVLPAIGDDEEEGTAEYEAALRYGAWQIIQLIIPVTICMAVVVVFELTVAAREPPSNVQLLYLPLHENEAKGGGQTFLFALVNALVFVALILVMTVLLVCLFKYRCYKAIYVWLLVASAILLFVISSVYFIEILNVHNLVLDWFSFAFFIWNFGVMGLMVIHWKGPLRLQQAYLILISALVATVFLKYLPNWTTWIVLVAISLYDLFAVLCPKGPLRVLVETAKERNENIFPSLIYSSTMVWIVGMADNGSPAKKQRSSSASSSNSGTDEETSQAAALTTGAAADDGQPPPTSDGEERGGASNPQQQPDQQTDEEEPRGFKLGLGDFIFYSILVGKAAHDSSGDWVILSSCFVAILIGLCITSLILGIVRRALPALPISILFGVIFYFSSRYLISPFVDTLATNQVFI